MLYKTYLKIKISYIKHNFFCVFQKTKIYFVERPITQKIP